MTSIIFLVTLLILSSINSFQSFSSKLFHSKIRKHCAFSNNDKETDISKSAKSIVNINETIGKQKSASTVKDTITLPNKVNWDFIVFTFLSALAITISYADRSNLSTAM